MLKALSQSSVYKSLITEHFTVLASLSTACQRALIESDVRRRTNHQLLRLSSSYRECLLLGCPLPSILLTNFYRPCNLDDRSAAPSTV